MNARTLLDESYAWIRNNIRATNLDVPDQLIAAWIYEDPNDDSLPKGYCFSVFSYGYVCFACASSGSPKASVKMSELLSQYDKWQMKLALAELHRHTELQVEASPLFASADDETFQVHRRA